MKWRLMVAVLAVFATQANADSDAIPEDSYADVDLTFSNSIDQPLLCPIFDYEINDKNTGKIVLAKTTENNPASKPCKACNIGPSMGESCLLDADCGGAVSSCAVLPGCVRIRLLAAANPYVGRCQSDKSKGCTAHNQCSPPPCVRDAKEVSQLHTLSGVCQPGDPSQYTFWADLTILNGQYVPLQ